MTLVYNCSFFIYFRCAPCQKERSIREGSFFFNANLTLIKILEIMYSYSFETATCRSLHREVGIESEAITNWQNFIRDDFAEYLLRHPVVIGGDGRTVEIDESAFLRKKHNVGREVRTQWVFGGTDTTTHEGFLVAIPQQNAATLLPILQQYVRPGTTVICDLWRAYNTIGNLGYQYLTVNHSVNIVDPVTQATTNHVESMWARAKQRNKHECGTHRSLLTLYLLEFMWRQQFGRDPFQKLLEHIRETYAV